MRVSTLQDYILRSATRCIASGIRDLRLLGFTTSDILKVIDSVVNASSEGDE